MVEAMIRRRIPVEFDLESSVSWVSQVVGRQAYQRPPYSSPYFSITSHNPFPAKVILNLMIGRVPYQFWSQAIDAEIMRNLGSTLQRDALRKSEVQTLTAVPKSPRCASSRPQEDQYGPMTLRKRVSDSTSRSG